MSAGLDVGDREMRMEHGREIELYAKGMVVHCVSCVPTRNCLVRL